MLVIRLNRTGSKKRAHYRVVVADSSQARDSRFVEILGHYDPRAVPAVVRVNRERIEHWIKAGARPSDTIRTLMARHLTAEPAVAERPGATGPLTPTGTTVTGPASEAPQP